MTTTIEKKTFNEVKQKCAVEIADDTAANAPGLDETDGQRNAPEPASTGY
jgi:hypothetical protein